jgi:hypothetical protein
MPEMYAELQVTSFENMFTLIWGATYLSACVTSGMSCGIQRNTSAMNLGALCKACLSGRSFTAVDDGLAREYGL